MGSLISALLREMSQGNEYGLFIDNQQRVKILSACFDAYYHSVDSTRTVVFDTWRHWTTKLPLLTVLYPQAKIICCVRNVAWVLDSIESLIRAAYLEPSKIFNFEPGGTVYTRVEGLVSNARIVGSALRALREAVFGEHSDRLLLVRYETLTADPLGVLASIYGFIGEPLYPHDPAHIEPCPGAIEFDARARHAGAA